MARDENFFNVLRVIFLALNSDGHFSIAEHRWIHRIMDAHGFGREDRLVIDQDAANPPDLRDLLRRMSLVDRDKLVAFVETAVTVDGKIESAELAFPTGLHEAIGRAEAKEFERDRSRDSASGLADALVDHANRLMLWKALQVEKDNRRWWRRTSSWLRGF